MQVRKRKLANTDLPIGGQTDSQVDASSKKAISVQPCTRTSTKENNTEANLRWVAKRLKTCLCLRTNLSSIKVDASHHKPFQVHVMAKGSRKLCKFSTCVNLRLHLVRALKVLFNVSINQQELAV